MTIIIPPKLHHRIRGDAILLTLKDTTEFDYSKYLANKEKIFCRMMMKSGSKILDDDNDRMHTNPDDCPTYFDGCHCSELTKEDMAKMWNKDLLNNGAELTKLEEKLRGDCKYCKHHTDHREMESEKCATCKHNRYTNDPDDHCQCENCTSHLKDKWEIIEL